MNENPWQVESLQDFLYLKCPECSFDAKEEEVFEYHATENHPLSFVFFGKTFVKEEALDLEEYNLVSENIIVTPNFPEITDIKKEFADDDDNEEKEKPRWEIFFFSSRSLKTREKYISLAQFVYFLREVCLFFNF